MQLHNLTGKNIKKKRVGRGGKRGTYSGRGGKGQTARAGHRIRPAIRDYLKQIPKRRGRHKHSFVSVQTKPVVVNIHQLDRMYASGETVNPKTLVAKNLVIAAGSRLPKIKILGEGKLTKKITIQECLVSESAKRAIEAVGGTVEKS